MLRVVVYCLWDYIYQQRILPLVSGKLPASLIRRFVHPTEVAHLGVFLASEQRLCA